LGFTLSSGSHYFLELAKFRAARMLWASIVQAYDATANGQTFIHATTSERSLTIYDPWTNMLRGTTQAMSAVLGGCNSLTVSPYNTGYQEATEFSNRIGRNVQLVLKEEAMLTKVADPAGGSHYIETLTNAIAESAWRIFQDIEAQGGYLEALNKGSIQAHLEQASKAEENAILTSEKIVLGVNKYPNQEERMQQEVTQKPNSTSEHQLDLTRPTEPMERERLNEEETA